METYFNNLTAAEGSAEKLVQDVQVLIKDGEDLLRNGCQVLGDQSRVTARQAAETVRRYPYASVGAAFALGVFVGLLAGKKQTDR